MPKIVDHDQYRAELLHGSFALFARHGYANLSMRHIAQELGVSTGTLYHYFPSKDALFDALARTLSEQDLLTATTDLSEATDRDARVHALFTHLEHYETHYLHQLLILTDHARLSPTPHPPLQAGTDHLTRGLAELLPCTLDEARFVLATLNGLILERHLTGRPVPYQATARFVLRALESGAA